MEKYPENLNCKTIDFTNLAENVFVSNLDNLFDIAHAEALTKMSIEEDRQFLIMQRQTGRPGSMCGVDKKLLMREKRSEFRKEKEQARKRKYDEIMQKTTYSEYDCSDEDFGEPSTNISHIDDNDDDSERYEQVEAENEELQNVEDDNKRIPNENLVVVSRGTKQFITPRLVAALDNAKVSDGMAVHILIAAAEALGHCVDKL